MFKIDSANATPDNQFQDSNIALGIPGTTATAEWLNAVQAELIAVIVGGGLSPSKADSTQLFAAISNLIADGGGGGGGGGGSPYWINPVSDEVDLPAGKPNGTICLVTSVSKLYRFNGLAWVLYYDPAELAAKINAALIGVAGGVAPLDSGAKVPVSFLPNYNPWLVGVNYSSTGAVAFGTLCIAHTASAFSLTLPDPTTLYQQVGMHRSGANNLTVYPPSGKKFHGLATNAPWIFTQDNQSAIFIWDGTELVPAFLGNTGSGGGGGGPSSTDGLPEGATNLYYTDARVLTALSTQKNVANGIAGLDANGKLADSVLPDLSITKTNVVGNQTAMLALVAQEGDVAVRTDLVKTFILRQSPASTLANWQELLVPTNSVISVNGLTGAVVLTKNDIGLGNIDNTADLNKPVSSAQQAALDLKVNSALIGAVSGVAPLDTNSRVPLVHLPSLKTFTYFANADFEDTANGVLPAGWAKYNDGSVASPLDATGGTATGVDLVVSTTSPIRGTRSAVLSKDAFNRQGCGASYNLTIAKPDRWKTEKLYIEIETSANFVAGDATIHLLDTTNNVWIPATVAAVPKLDGMGLTVSFDLTNSLTYRFAFHIATTNALAWDLKFDTLLLNGDKVYSSGGPNGLFEQVNTFTVTASANPTPGAGAKFYRRTDRNLDRAKIRYEFYQNAAGSDGTGVYHLPIPAGLTIDTTKIGVAANIATSGPTNKCGEGIMGINAAVVGCQAYVSSATTISISFDNQGASGTSWLTWGQGAGGMANGLVRFGIDVDLPILQWAGSGDSAVAGTDKAYYSNSNNTNASSDSNSANMVSGGNGSLIPNGAAGTNYSRTVRLARPYQAGDALELQVDQAASNWTNIETRLGPAIQQGINEYGTRIIPVVGSTDVVINFLIGGFLASGATYGANGTPWSTLAAWRWRLAHYNPEKPSGVYAAGENRSGFISRETEGSFTGSFSGVTGTITGSFTYARTGKQVTIQLAGNVVFTKDASAGIVTISGLPAAIIPSAESYGTPAGIAYNGVAAAGNTRITVAGTIQLYRSSAEDVWAASSTGVLVRGAITYRLP